MSVGISTSWFGVRPVGESALLDLMRAVGVRDAFVAPESPRPLTAEVAGAVRDVGARFAGVAGASDRAAGGVASLLSQSSEVVRRSMQSMQSAIADARALHTDLVVVQLGIVDLDRGKERESEVRAKLRLEGPTDDVRRMAATLAQDVERRRDMLLERSCRVLFECLKLAPDMRFAVSTPTSLIGFPTFSACRTLLDEFKGRALGYWHDSTAARVFELLGLAPALAWSGEHATRAFGATMGDFAGGEERLPPGAGEIDFKGLRETLPGALTIALDVDSKFGVRQAQEAVTFLRSLGFT